jgi:hypothetical protein
MDNPANEERQRALRAAVSLFSPSFDLELIHK